ncbi:MAG TPA: PDZ domain-containing protein, partial [Sunxiuqinia sp.]|nr:PDZ domain-containing protein [Sunxiuqinia sp.]
MNKIVKLLFVGLIVSFVFYSCSKNNDSVVPETTTDTTSTSGTNSISADTIAINKWISESMIQVYLWNDLIPKVNYQKEPNPTAFFYKMLNKPIDRWSFITNDYASLNAEFSGVPETMGYDPAFYRYSNSDKSVFIVIDYVYPGSPAAEAGLKRGDIIVSINNNPLNTSNY